MVSERGEKRTVPGVVRGEGLAVAANDRDREWHGRVPRRFINSREQRPRPSRSLSPVLELRKSAPRPARLGEKVRPWGGRLRILAAPPAGAYNSGGPTRPVLPEVETDVRRPADHPLDRRAESRPAGRRPGALGRLFPAPGRAGAAQAPGPAAAGGR